MLFQSFTLKNYKGISNPITFDISNGQGKPYCILGNNESGKTTILKGIELIGFLCRGGVLENGRLSAIRPKETYFTGEIILSTVIKITDSEVEKITGKGKKAFTDSLKENDNTLTISFVYHFTNSSHKESEKLVFVGDKKQSEVGNIFDLIKAHAPEIIYYDDFKFDVPDKIRFLKEKSKTANPDLAKNPFLTKEQNTFWQKIFNDLLIGSSNKVGDEKGNQFQRDIIDWSSNNDGDDDAVEQRLVAINDYLNKVVTNDWEDITGEKSIFDRFSIKRTNVSNEPDFIDFNLRVEAKGKSFLLHERSKGCKWFFCFKILTDIRKHRNNRGTLFLLDEPASNLHIHPQEKILHSLEKLSHSEKSNVIYSTHSPFLIKPEDKENIFIVNNISDSELETPKIVCIKLEDYKLNNDKAIRAIEPIFNRISTNAVCTLGNTWKERLNKLAKIPEFAEKINDLVDFVKNFQDFIPKS